MLLLQIKKDNLSHPDIFESAIKGICHSYEFDEQKQKFKVYFESSDCEMQIFLVGVRYQTLKQEIEK